MIENNLLILEKRYPHLKDSYKNTKNLLEIVQSKKGLPTALYNGVLLHSKYDPLKEAVKIVNDIKKSNLIVISGLGLGYIVEEAVLRFPDSTIVIFEPNLDLFFNALLVRDFEQLLQNPNVYFMINRDPEELKNFLIPKIVKKISYIAIKNRVMGDEETFNKVSEIIRLYLERTKINHNTLLKFGKLWVKNQSRNLPQMGYKSDISKIFNNFNNIPGIIISAGPSMELIIPHLKTIYKRFVILAVDTAFKSLLDEGIEPDFVMSIDSQYWNARHLEVSNTEKSILIADSSIQPSALRSFKDRVYFTRSTFPLGQYFENQRAPFPKIASGGSVSTNIWDFANKLGLSEIFFIGQDLGFPGNITHYKESYFEKNMLITSNRLNPLENQSFSYIYNGFPTMVQSNNGEMILSDIRMGIYIDWFKEKLSLQKDNNSFNLSPNGCKIEGMELKSLKQFLDYPTKRSEIDFILGKLEKREPNHFLPQILLAAIHFKENLELVVKLSESASLLCKKIEANFHIRADINHLLEELTNIDNKIVSFNHSQTLSFIIEPFINQITESEEGTPLEALKLSGLLYQKIVKTGHLHIKYLNQSILTIKNKLAD